MSSCFHSPCVRTFQIRLIVLFQIFVGVSSLSAPACPSGENPKARQITIVRFPSLEAQSRMPGLAISAILLCFLFVLRSLINDPSSGDVVSLSFLATLPPVGLGPQKDILSLLGPSTSLCALFSELQRYKDTIKGVVH